ncbi:MAG: hypothetical protein A2504_08275 [Bdellovibrionales bacterium RIFOXYD12_FULL_39_22]|nr:MAG: hypothetical protein A2385_01500 [Bdellovibrionales bacterium RIFOXYB1_FULL_39_21]OFZ42879.1 MAG: hypothetical protein A2485_10870 [Bdellovibrionales bacterium RIFOXYC12_FULL_39_17]OFZ47461.1 MAG: hypothetical protein A2404_14420 [Bdellovibrionales bacterium RIFOXYC1_FULL_39_130]OFZ69775.1 MAG: hypothetical protein A2451_11595 [Bdellovibrionales bacterium RIFOXYC2_FULL_39_8]OFZ75549.1 MAG: hypothetical protein A2560_14570 [Bdellovibrionales bacterium RIFOXYD1_FULL_39_84]OFZ93872.1 MAG:
MQQKNHDSDNGEQSSVMALAFRGYWFFGWALPTLFVIREMIERPTNKIFIFFGWPAIYASVILTRFIDVRFYKGTTMDGEPATSKHLLSHAIRFLPFPLVGILITAFLK